MAILFLIAQIIDRDADLINLLAFAALVLLLINPAQLWDVGFQLSFAAVACIVYLLPKWIAFIADLSTYRSAQENHTDSWLEEAWGSGWKRATRWLVVAFGVTLSAQVGTFLIIAQHFCRAYPLGLIVGPFVVGLAATHRCHRIYLASARHDLASAGNTICLCQPPRPLYPFENSRILRSTVGGVENVSAELGDG